MAQKLPGEKRIERLGLRVEEGEKRALEERAREENVPTSFIHRQALRQYLNLEDPDDEHFPPIKRRE